MSDRNLSHSATTESGQSPSANELLQRLQRVRRRRLALSVLMLLWFYVGTYFMLSANGEYRPRPSGERRYPNGVAAFDLSIWYPYGMRWQRWRSVNGDDAIDSDLLGWFYLPMILMDRYWIHPTIDFFDAAAE